MKTHLILLDTPIIVSDEEIKVNAWYFWDTNKNEAPSLCIDSYNEDSIRDSDGFTNFYKCIAGIEGLPSIDWNGLEEEFGWVDVEKLFEKMNPQDGRCPKWVLDLFKKAQSLNDKKFSLDDIKRAIDLAQEEYYDEGGYQGLEYQPNYIINLIQQPKVFDIEIQTERVRYPKGEDGWEDIYKPKITNNSIKIIKKL